MAIKPKGSAAEEERSAPSKPEAIPEGEEPRVYTIQTSMLVYSYTPFLWRLQGEKVSSDEFVPPPGVTVQELEQRYIDIGALELDG